MLLPRFNRVGERAGSRWEQALSPGRSIHRDHIDVTIRIRPEHDAEFIAGLQIASPIQKNVPVLDGQVGLHTIHEMFFDQNTSRLIGNALGCAVSD